MVPVDNWRTFADSAWLVAAIPEEYGGLEGRKIESALIAHEFGRSMVGGPNVRSAEFAA